VYKNKTVKDRRVFFIGFLHIAFTVSNNLFASLLLSNKRHCLGNHFWRYSSAVVPTSLQKVKLYRRFPAVKLMNFWIPVMLFYGGDGGAM
jgi:hypothetical protein